VLRMIIAIVVGLVIAIGGTVLVVNVLSSHSNSTPGNSSTYNYGSR
jgi:flagellar basal body-associated protein FliL